jgi:hypothetical protein
LGFREKRSPVEDVGGEVGKS